MMKILLTFFLITASIPVYSFLIARLLTVPYRKKPFRPSFPLYPGLPDSHNKDPLYKVSN